MENQYIYAQIMNMKAFLTTFEQGCKTAAMKDDGRIDKEEEKVLKKINAVTKKYRAELDKLLR